MPERIFAKTLSAKGLESETAARRLIAGRPGFRAPELLRAEPLGGDAFRAEFEFVDFATVGALACPGPWICRPPGAMGEGPGSRAVDFRALGRALRNFHATGAPRAGRLHGADPNPERASVRAYLRRELDHYLDLAGGQGLLPEPRSRALCARLEDALAALPDAPDLVHGDCHPWNLGLPEAGEGFIFCDFHYTSGACGWLDLANLRRYLDPGQERALMEGYGPGPGREVLLALEALLALCVCVASRGPGKEAHLHGAYERLRMYMESRGIG